MGTVSYFRNRPTNQAAPNADTVQDPSQEIRPAQIIRDNQIYERAEARYAKAIEGIAVQCALYRRIVQGRRCTCRDTHDIPSGKCPVCYGVGLVGGYLQYGHEKYVLDGSDRRITLSNLEVWDNVEDMRPAPIALEKSPRGFVEGGEPIFINSALGYDGYRIYTRLPKGGGLVTPYYLRPSDGTWDLLDNLPTYLTSLGAAPWTLQTRFKIVLENYSPGYLDPTFFYALHVKWKVGEDIVPVEQASYSDITKKLTDLGFINALSGIHWTCNPRPQILDTDFMLKVNTGERFKVVEPQKNDPGDRPLWQDLVMRPVQSEEILAEVF